MKLKYDTSDTREPDPAYENSTSKTPKGTITEQISKSLWYKITKELVWDQVHDLWRDQSGMWRTYLAKRAHIEDILKLLIHNSQCEVALREFLQELRLLIHRNCFMNLVHKAWPITHACMSNPSSESFSKFLIVKNESFYRTLVACLWIDNVTLKI